MDKKILEALINDAYVDPALKRALSTLFSEDVLPPEFTPPPKAERDES